MSTPMSALGRNSRDPPPEGHPGFLPHTLHRVTLDGTCTFEFGILDQGHHFFGPFLGNAFAHLMTWRTVACGGGFEFFWYSRALLGYAALDQLGLQISQFKPVSFIAHVGEPAGMLFLFVEINAAFWNRWKSVTLPPVLGCPEKLDRR